MAVMTTNINDNINDADNDDNNNSRWYVADTLLITGITAILIVGSAGGFSCAASFTTSWHSTIVLFDL